MAPFHFLKISVNNFLISVDYVFIENAGVLDRNLDSRETLAATPAYSYRILSHWVFHVKQYHTVISIRLLSGSRTTLS